MEFEWALDAEPNDLRWEDNDTRIGVTWNDGHESTYPLSYVRLICPCAECRKAHDHPPIRTEATAPSFRILTPAQAQLARPNAEVKEAYPIGGYAIGFRWGDDHDSGIYSYRFLRAMCPCPTCSARLQAEYGSKA
jgi:DUF971 family protein